MNSLTPTSSFQKKRDSKEVLRVLVYVKTKMLHIFSLGFFSSPNWETSDERSSWEMIRVLEWIFLSSHLMSSRRGGREMVGWSVGNVDRCTWAMLPTAHTSSKLPQYFCPYWSPQLAANSCLHNSFYSFWKKNLTRQRPSFGFPCFVLSRISVICHP